MAVSAGKRRGVKRPELPYTDNPVLCRLAACGGRPLGRRGEKSLTLDLKAAAGAKAFRKLVMTVDSMV